MNAIKRLHHRIYNWYIDGDHLLLRFILGRGAFHKYIKDKWILCKNCGNSQQHIINDCVKQKN